MAKDTKDVLLNVANSIAELAKKQADFQTETCERLERIEIALGALQTGVIKDALQECAKLRRGEQKCEPEKK
jgi:hypothetical protein